MVSYWAHLSKNYKLTWCFFESLTRFFQRNKLCCLLFWQLCWGLLAINVSWWFKCERNKSKGSWQTHKPSMLESCQKMVIGNSANKKTTNCFCIIIFMYSSLYEYVTHIATTLMKESTRLHSCIGIT